ncbi:MAG: prepilin-type N-terminal cleavage/methylation domain-containing protein [Chitinispirillaceae bacterium]|nr:prepilin-type N-terminal cleavage/methylation domain-containing protein [Chitinispirillaceae bacterium]
MEISEQNPRQRSRNGFTLVEAIVVGVILAVLTTAAVVVYTGFIRETRQQTTASLAETAAAAANAYTRKTNSNLASGETDVPKLHLYYDENKYTITIEPDGSGDITGQVRVVFKSDETIFATALY